MARRRVYLDNSATTPVDPRVAAAMARALSRTLAMRRASTVLGSRRVLPSIVHGVKSPGWLVLSRMRLCSLRVALKQTTSQSAGCAKRQRLMGGTSSRQRSNIRRLQEFVSDLKSEAGRSRVCRFMPTESSGLKMLPEPFGLTLCSSRLCSRTMRSERFNRSVRSVHSFARNELRVNEIYGSTRTPFRRGTTRIKRR